MKLTTVIQIYSTLKANRMRLHRPKRNDTWLTFQNQLNLENVQKKARPFEKVFGLKCSSFSELTLYKCFLKLMPECKITEGWRTNRPGVNVIKQFLWQIFSKHRSTSQIMTLNVTIVTVNEMPLNVRNYNPIFCSRQRSLARLPTDGQFFTLPLIGKHTKKLLKVNCLDLKKIGIALNM